MLESLINELKTKGQLYIKVKVRPSSAKTEVKEILDDGTIKISIAAKPLKGQANSELINYLSINFNCKKTNIIILSGKTEKIKLIKLSY